MPASMQITEFRDDDLIHILRECANEEGFATTQDVAEKCGLTHENPNNCVGGRFAYLKRIGILENRKEGGETRWRLTDIGEELMVTRKLPASLLRALEGMGEGERIVATNALAAEVANGTSYQGQQLARRAWRHHTTPTPATT